MFLVSQSNYKKEYSSIHTMYRWLLLLACSAAIAHSQWVVQLDPHIDPHQFAQEHHLKLEKKLDYLSSNVESFYQFQETPQSNARGLQQLRSGETPGVQWAERQEPRTQYKRVPDPLYASQWHLHTHPYGIEADREPNVTGKGVVIAVVDDGLQWRHPEIHPNYNEINSWDFNGQKADPTPTSRHDAHGTAAAAVAAAAGHNGHCGRGVAHKAKLAGIRLIAGPASDATESEALSYNAIGGVDIYSCSWGPQDDGMTFGPMGYLTARTLARFVNGLHGRLGKGSIYVWASGNGRANGDTCAFDGYAGSPYVIPIGATDHLGNASWYSEGCSALMGVTPSSGAMKGIVTADLMGSAGYTPTECSDRFGGTSSAAPLAAGIVALMLEERPELTWRDVKHIIARGASPNIQTHDRDWHQNRRGYRHSHQYGFGLLRVPPLMHAMRIHQLVPPEKVLVLPVQQFPDATGVIPLNHTFVVTGSDLKFVEHVMLKVYILHPQRGRVTIQLQSPEGTISRLAEHRPLDKFANYPPTGWSFTSVRHWGESHVNGDWRIVVDDVNKQEHNVGTVTQMELTLFGY